MIVIVVVVVMVVMPVLSSSKEDFKAFLPGKTLVKGSLTSKTSPTGVAVAPQAVNNGASRRSNSSQSLLRPSFRRSVQD